MKKIPIKKNTVQETLVIPLYARKLGNELFPHIFRDPYADEITNRLDYDFAGLDQKKNSYAWKFGTLAGILRSRDILYEMEKYLSCHPNAAVVNLGCGLDQTPLSADNGRMTLYNIDVKEVIDMRKMLFSPRERVIDMAADLNGNNWIDGIDGSGGIFLFAMGVFMYFKKDEVRQMIVRIKSAFPHGCLVFDTLSKLGIHIAMKRTLDKIGIHDVHGIFYCDHPLSDLKLAEDIQISVRKYMTGYVDLKEAGVPFHLRFMASVFDWLFKMNICRLYW